MFLLRRVVCSFTAVLLFAQIVCAQEVKLVYSQDIAAYREVIAGFKSVYTKPFDAYDLKGSPARLTEVMGNLLQADLIVTIGLLSTIIVRDEIRDIPSKRMVFSMLFDPARFLLPDSVAAGVALDILPSTLFSEIKQIFPNVHKIGILYDPQKNKKIVEAYQQAAKDYGGLSIISTPVLVAKDVPRAVDILLGQVDLLWIIPDSTVISRESMALILSSSLAYRVPVLTFSEELVKMGAVASLSFDYKSIGEALGRLAKQVLQGKEPSDIPLQYAERSRLTINQKAAKKLGIEIPAEILRRANRFYDATDD